MKYEDLCWVILVVSDCCARDVTVSPTEPQDVIPLPTRAQSSSFSSPTYQSTTSPIASLLPDTILKILPSKATTEQPPIATTSSESTQSSPGQPWQTVTGRQPRSPNTGGLLQPGLGDPWPPGTRGPWPPGPGGPWTPGSGGQWPSGPGGQLPPSSGQWPPGPTPWYPPDRWMLQPSNWTQPPNSVQPTMNPIMGWQGMDNSSIPFMSLLSMLGLSNASISSSLPPTMESPNSSMPMMSNQMPGSSNSSMPMMPSLPMPESSNSSMPIIPLLSMPGISNVRMPIMQLLSTLGLSNYSISPVQLLQMLGIDNSSTPSTTMLPSMPPGNYDRIAGERRIKRPCEINDMYCIRRYLRKHSQCKERYGPVPEPLYRAVSSAYFVRVNLTVSREDVLYTGLNGRITEFYVNPETDNLVLTVLFRNLGLQSNNTFFKFHRQLQEPVVTRDFFNVFYSSLEVTIIIPNLKDLQLHKSEVFTYVLDGAPQIAVGPEAFLSNAYAASVLPEFLADMQNNVREDALTNGAFYIGSFIQYKLCDFGLQVL